MEYMDNPSISWSFIILFLVFPSPNQEKNSVHFATKIFDISFCPARNFNINERVGGKASLNKYILSKTDLGNNLEIHTSLMMMKLKKKNNTHKKPTKKPHREVEASCGHSQHDWMPYNPTKILTWNINSGRLF